MRVINLRPEREGHAAPITHVAFRPDGRRLSTCSYDGTVIIWDTTDPKYPTRLATMRHRRLVNAAAWHPTQGPDELHLGFETPDGAFRSLARLDGRYLSTEVAGGFTGRVIGMYAAAGTVRFDWFDYRGAVGEDQ